VGDADRAPTKPLREEAGRLAALLASGRAAEVVDAVSRRSDGELATRPEWLVLLSEAHLALGATDLAVRRAREATRVPGASADAAGAALVFALARRADAASLTEARRAIDPLVESARARHDEGAARVHHADGVLRLREGRLEEARLALLDALAAATVAADARRCAAVRDSLGLVHARLGDALRALAHYDASLRAKAELGDVGGRAITHGNRGRLLLTEGRADAALAEFDADVELSRSVGDAYGVAAALNGRGLALVELRRLDEAETALRESLALAESRADARQTALAVKDLAILAEARGRRDEAVALATDAASRFERMGGADGAGFALCVLGRMLFRAGDSAAARAKYRRAVELLRTTRRSDLLAEALVRSAEAADDDASALRLLDEADALAREQFRRDIARDVRAVREGIAGRASDRRVSASRNSVGFGRDRREFRLVARIGRGGQADAWKALDVETGRLVVVKRQKIATEADPTRSRADVALREFEAAMRLDHRGVVRVFAAERVGDELLVAMDLLPGPDLASRLVEGPRAPDKAWSWIADIAEAVDALHGAGIVHRDLKPENVVFDSVGRPVVIDFGLALLDDRGDPLAGRIVGTPGYGAPEQWRGRAVDHRADLFAFGVVAVEILTGRNFLRADSAARTVAEFLLLMRDAARVAALADAVAWPDHVGPPARAAIRRLLDPEPSARPASASEALAACGRSRPTTSPSPCPPGSAARS